MEFATMFTGALRVDPRRTKFFGGWHLLPLGPLMPVFVGA